MRAGVVGASGGMGGWLTRHLRSLGHTVTAIDTRTGLQELDEFDLVVVSVPISSTPEVIRTVAPLMRRDAVLAEIASLKAGSHRALAETARLDVKPLCVHPMFGPSVDSLRGRVVAVVPVVDEEGEHELAEWLFPGADLVTLDAVRHDHCMAVVLSLPYAVNLAFAKALSGEDLALATRMAGSTFALQYTLAQSVAGESPTLARDLLGNESLGPLLHAFAESLGEVVESTECGRFEALHSEIVEALRRDPSFAGADARRQKAHRALSA
jgi:prephenate dehydrogenase